MQAEYHGFGTTVTPDKLKREDGKPIQAALQLLLSQPSFTVSSQTPIAMSLYFACQVQVMVHFIA